MVNTSIIIRARNEVQWLRLLLPLLKKQTVQDFEIILVNNKSTDGSVDFALENSYKVLSIEEYTPGRALNIGVSSSEGNNIAAVTSRDQRDIVENMIGDINKIVPFVSVDAIVGSTISLQLARESNIQSAPNTEGLGIQSL